MFIASTLLLVASALAPLASAKLHSAAVCVNKRSTEPVGGTAFSVSYTWKKDYEIAIDATRCACDHYKARNTGNNQWDKCPDCHFDGIQCLSDGWHIGGDEMTYYCEDKCSAHGAEAN